MMSARKNKSETLSMTEVLHSNEWEGFIASVPAIQPVYLTVANYGYLDLVLNLFHSLQCVTTLEERCSFVVLTGDKKLFNALKSWPCISTFYVDYKPWSAKGISSSAVTFKTDDWNAITRFKLLAIHMVLQAKRAVFYVDPDVAFVKNPAAYLEKLRGDTLYFQKGTPYCTGVIFAHPANQIATEIFDPAAWKECGQDDETYVKTAVRHQLTKRKVPEALIQTFDFKVFPNGLVWKDNQDDGTEEAKQMIAEKECVLFHFNHITGLENKINQMRTTKVYNDVMRVARVPDKFRPALDQICLEKQGTTYPPHHEGDHLEEACERLVTTTLRQRVIVSKYTYLPVHWTALAVTKNGRLLNDLREWAEQFFATHKKEKFWTVVQHCKGLYGSCGVTIPNRVKLFMTSDPKRAMGSFIPPRYEKKVRPTIDVKKVEAMKRVTRTQQPGIIRAQSSASDMQRVLKHRQALDKSKGNERKDIVPIQKKPRTRPNYKEEIRIQHIKMRAQTQMQKQPVTARKLPQMPTFGVEKKWITVPLVSGKHVQRTNLQRNLLASFMGNIDIHPIRHRIKVAFDGVDDVVVQSGAYRDKTDVQSFQELMQRSVFALCPRGYGTTSFRLTEAMDYGCIPVYISDTFSIPFEDEVNIHDVCILVKPNEIEKLPKRLRSIKQEEINRLRANIKLLRERFFTLHGCCRTILFDYIDGKDY